MYMHMYPRRYQTKNVLGCDVYFFHYVVLPALHYLALVMDEIYWDDRLDPYNHVIPFPFLVTGMVDTFPVRVLQPTNSEIRKRLYNPKYGACVYKVQLAIDFRGIL